MSEPYVHRLPEAELLLRRLPFSSLCMPTLVAAILTQGLNLGVPSLACAMSLSQAVSGAESVDAKLAAARAGRDGAAQSISIARSRMLPQVSLQGSLQDLQHRSASLESLLAAAPREYKGTSSNGQLSIRQALVRPRDKIGMEVGKSEARLGEFALVTARTDLWARTVEAWADALSAQEAAFIQARTLGSVEKAVQQERERFQKGNGTKDSLAEAEAQMAMSAAQLAEARLNLDAKLQVLEQHTGISPNSMTRRTVPSAEQLGLPFASADEALAAILGSNAELDTAREQLEVARLRADQARYDHFPTLDAVASLTEAKSDTSDTLGTRYRSQRIGVQLSIPLYTGGGLSAAQKQADLSRESAVAEVKFVEQQIQRRVRADWGIHAGLLQRLAAADRMVSAAQEVRKATELSVGAGLRTWADVASAEMNVSKREADRNELLVNLLRSKTRILALLPVGHPAWSTWVLSLDQGTARAGNAP